MKKRTVLEITLLLVCLGVLGVVIGRQFMPQFQFPMWEQAQEREGNSSVSLALEDLSFAVGSQNGAHDEITIEMENRGAETGYGMGYALEFFHGGAWYRVYAPEEVMGLGILFPPGEKQEVYKVPMGLLNIQGEYRLYVDGLGYCEFRV